MYDKRIYNTNSGIITFQQLLQTIRKFSFMGFFFAHTVFCIAAQITHSKKKKKKKKNSSWDMDENALGQSDCRVFKSNISLEENETAWFFLHDNTNA